jgi:hypothetical protein
VKLHNVPEALVLNTDQTGVQLVPNATYQRAPCGAKSVSCNGSGEKRQITANPTTAADGTSLPLQLIYQGKTQRCLPAGNYQHDPRFKGWQWNWSENHWANFTTTQTHIMRIIAPYRDRVVAELGLPADQKCILLLDCWPVCKLDRRALFTKACLNLPLYALCLSSDLYTVVLVTPLRRLLPCAFCVHIYLLFDCRTWQHKY